MLPWKKTNFAMFEVGQKQKHDTIVKKNQKLLEKQFSVNSSLLKLHRSVKTAYNSICPGNGKECSQTLLGKD